MAAILAAAPQFLVASHLDAYLAVGAEELRQQVVGRGVRITKALERRPWGRRDFHVEDPDGYILCFGETIRGDMREFMRRVRFSVAMSLDGFIAGPNGESDWIVMDPEIDFRALMADFDTVVLGRKTYEATRQHGGGGMPGMQAYVFSRTLRQADCPGVIVSETPGETLRALKAKPGKDIWLFGGGSLFRSLLELRLVDAVEVAVIPVLLGVGVPLRPQPAKQVPLRLVKNRMYQKTGTLWLEYAPA